MSERSTDEIVTSPLHTLSDYESFVAENWIYPIGSDEAQQHARSKLSEEVGELTSALESGLSDDIKSEMGDVLWTAEAVAINEGFTLEDAFRNNTVSKHLPKSEPTIADIDTIAQSSTVVWDVPIMRALHGLTDKEVSERIEDGDLHTEKLVLESLAHQLGKSARITRELPAPEDGFSRLYEARVAESLVQIILLVSRIAQTRLGSSLTEIMTDNRNKLLDRLSNKQPVTKEPRH